MTQHTQDTSTPSASRSTPLKSRAIPLAIFIFGCTISAILFFLLMEEQRLSTRLLFDSRADECETLIAKQFMLATDGLYAAQAFFSGSQKVERAEFDEFVSRLLRRDDGLQGIAWAPLVKHELRDAHERSQRQEMPGYTISEAAGNARQRSADRRHYFPITYAVAGDDAVPPFGLDVGSDPATRGWLDSAIDGGQATLLPRSKALPGPQYLLVALPVHESGLALTDSHQRRKHLRGILLGTLNCERIVEVPLADLAPGNIRVRVVLEPDSASPKLIYARQSRTSRAAAVPERRTIPRSLQSSHEISLAGPPVAIQISATPALLAETLTVWPHVTLFGGALLSLLSAFYVRMLMRQRTRMEELVRQRTREIESAKNALEESEARFQQIASNLEDILWMTSADGSEIIYVSSAYESIWGRSCDSLYKQPRDWTDGIHPDDRDRVTEAFYQRAALGGYDEVFRVVRPDGAINWVHAKGFPIRDEIGEVYRIAGVARDITESKQYEAQLLEANEILRSTTAFQRAVLNSTAYSIITTDPNGLITTFNQGAERMLGYQADEVIGRVTPEILHDKEEVIAYAGVLSEQLGRSVEPGFETFVARARGGEADEQEWTYIRKDGSRVPVLLSVTAICDEEGNITGFLGVAKDITRRKEAEQELLEAKQEAEKASRAKSEFLASMSHELRTPLNGVIGMTELLAGTDLNSKQRQFVDACRSSGESLLSLVNDILDFSKIEAGKLELDLHDFDLEKLVTDTVDTMAWRAAEKDLEIPCYIDQISRTILKGDSTRLRQVLVNLLSNGIKFTETGHITVRTKTVGRADDRIRIRFSISDTGIGIPSDKRDRLFQSFSQVDASTTRDYGGTGLGLAISQRLVEMMGGTIGVESEEGVGSTFWFEVPLALVSESSEDFSQTSPLAGRRILIVDDNETNRLILTEYSAEWGASAVEVASVEEALSAVEQARSDGSPFHVVLTDYNMPRRNGLELAAALKDHPQLVVLLLGSTDDPFEPEKLREHGIDASLRKPIRRHELYEVICRLLGNCHEDNASAGSSAGRQVKLPPSHILLAEDNRINQMYMTELMKELGCTCDTVANGHEAIEAVQQREYDLVLMDCQMPKLDGFEATRQIRQLETDGTLDNHLPIVALTANAIKGDRERCLDAGMDDYLAKPVEKQQVISVLEPLLTGTQERSDETVDAVDSAARFNQSSGSTPIDPESLVARCFNNLEFAGSLLDELEATGVTRMQEIQQLVTKRNADEIAEAAHALKGAAGILCAESLQKAAAEIERAARSSDMEAVESGLEGLAAEMQRCLHFLPQLRYELNDVKRNHV